MASSSLTQRRNEENDAFSGIEPHGTRRKVEESSKLFDVFINHRGPDVKQTVALLLYNSLAELGIHAFLDSEEKELGDSFPSTIENAIYSASAHIAIFSKGYAESPWCLAELVLMLQSRAKIFPVFHEVKPSDLRYIEKGKYAMAFTKYEGKRRYIEKLEEWKEALQSVSFITGYEISSGFNISDRQTIVSAVQKEVGRKKCLHVAKYPVGLHRLVEDFERTCLDQLVEDFERQCWPNEGGEGKAQIVGIFGMGGVGKTTLAKELFNRKHCQYGRACFLFDVREAYANNSFPSLQLKLLKDLFQKDRFSFQSIEEGKSHIADCIERSKPLSFLIVLDDIDGVQQLDSLLIMEMLKNSVNSLVLVTTRDVRVLINTGITDAYNLKGMERDDARELFCWHAFGQPYPDKDYENLVNSFLNVCGGLPLSLQVLDSHVHVKKQDYWSLELNKVSKTLPRHIHQRLKISFDALDYEGQQIFMDIACFFVDQLKSIAMELWEASGWSSQHALETLKNKCLVQEIEESFMGARVGEERCALRMHDHLRDLGREMADRLSRPRRLWRPQDLKYLESKGFRYILAHTNGRCFHSFFDKTMNCRITYFLGESDVSADPSTLLLGLNLEHQAFHNHRPLNLRFTIRVLSIRVFRIYFSLYKLQQCIPSWIPLKNLRCLIINNLRVKPLWRSHVQGPAQLKELQIYNTSFKDFPSLSGVSSRLEKITIDNCSRLKTMSGLSHHKKLIQVNISNCPDLQELSVLHLSCVEKLLLHNCYNLKTMTGISDLMKLVELDISGCPLFEQLRVVGLNNLKRIKVDDSFKPACFELDNCRNLETISGTLILEKLASIHICDCPKLELLPSLEGPGKLDTVTIDGCVKLNSLLLSRCENLKTVTGKFDVTTLFIWDCPELEALNFLQCVSCLETITIDGCGKLNNLQLLKCHNLKQLSISNCPELEELSCFEYQTCLEKISVVKCGKMKNITLPPQLVELLIEGCRELKAVAGICNQCECLESDELSSVARQSCLKRIKFRIVRSYRLYEALLSCMY